MPAATASPSSFVVKVGSGADADTYVIDFPTLWVMIDWQEAHCILPDSFGKGAPFVQYPWQLWCTANHYRVKPTATVGQLAPAFHYRRSQVVGPQKLGKGPWVATLICGEAVGPAVFCGWAAGGEVYRCSDWGCDCGWAYEYQRGEPMGRPWPTPLIQITATAQEQVDNIYNPLQSMIRYGPLGDIMRVGEEFIRLPNDGRIDAVTASAKARIGQPVTTVVQDEVGLYTKQNKLLELAQNQRRGAAGMGGRTIGLTNAWDPSEDSDAQRTAESKRPDIFKFHREPKPGLKYTVKDERRRIHRYVYAGSDHVDLDGIEAEAAELLEKDPEQAERFFGNKIVYGGGTYFPDDLWDLRLDNGRVVKKGTEICVGFDGSDVDDWTAFRAETVDGFRFTPTYGPEKRATVWKPEESDGTIPRDEVAAALSEIADYYKLVRIYGDPPDWRSEIGDWSGLYGEGVVYEWWTNRVPPMYEALRQSLTDYKTGRSTHDGCPDLRICWRNARKRPRPNQRYILGKPSQSQKIDVVMADVLAHIAAADARADGWKVRVPQAPRRLR